MLKAQAVAMSQGGTDHSCNVDLCDVVSPDFLKNKMKARGTNPHAIAVKVAEIRERKTGKKYDPTRLRNTVVGAIENPGRSKLDTISEIVEALGGRLVCRWEETEVIEKTIIEDEEL